MELYYRRAQIRVNAISGLIDFFVFLCVYYCCRTMDLHTHTPVAVVGINLCYCCSAAQHIGLGEHSINGGDPRESKHQPHLQGGRLSQPQDNVAA